jgi:hypothetical protein
MPSFNRQISSGQGRKNLIINGNFDIWQRNTSQTISGYGSADRYNCFHQGSTKTHSRQSFTLGQTGVPNNPTYYSRTVVASVSNAANYVAMQQIIEDVYWTSGETITYSFWARADSVKNISISLIQYFGSGGSASVNADAKKFTLSTSWQKFTRTWTMESIAGKTVVPGHGLAVVIWFDAGSNYNAQTDTLGQQSGTFDISQFQLEKGSVATEFEYRPLAEELVLCQRYYEKSYPQETSPGAVNFLTGAYYNVGYSTTSGRKAMSIPYKVTKRISPTLTTYDYAGNANRITTLDNIGNVASNNITPTLIIGDSAFLFYVDSSASSGAIVNWVADADF